MYVWFDILKISRTSLFPDQPHSLQGDQVPQQCRAMPLMLLALNEGHSASATDETSRDVPNILPPFDKFNKVSPHSSLSSTDNSMWEPQDGHKVTENVAGACHIQFHSLDAIFLPLPQIESYAGVVSNCPGREYFHTL